MYSYPFAFLNSFPFLFSLTITSSLPFFFFLVIGPPPSSTLFPYTTLFRSPGARAEPRRRRHPRGLRVADQGAGVRRRAQPARAARRAGPARRRGGDHRRRAHRRHAGQGDRKSTRLNSSHLVISYAVFCLKK